MTASAEMGFLARQHMRLRQLLATRSVLASVSMLSKVATRAGTFLVVAPIIGPSNQGTIVVTTAWAAVILLVMAYGLQVRILREAAINSARAHSIVVNDLAAMALLSLPAFLIAAIVEQTVLPAEYRAAFVMLYLATMCTVVGDYCSSALRGLDSYFSEAMVSLTMSVLQLVCAVAAAIGSTSVLYLAGAILLSRVIYAAVSLLVVFRNPVMRATVGPREPRVRRTIRESFPYFADGSLAVLLGQIDIILLTRLTDRASIGMYAVGSRLVQLFLVIPWIATAVMVPAIARSEGTDRFHIEIRRLLTAIAAVAGLGALVMLLGGPLFTAFILGHRYAGLNALWIPFAVLTVARFYDAYFGLIMTALGRLTARVYAQIGAVVLIGAGALVLVPRAGSAGLIAVIAVTYCLTGAFYAWRLKERTGSLDLYVYGAGAAIIALAVGTLAIGRHV